MVSDSDWQAHVKDSQSRDRELGHTIADLTAHLDSSIADLAAQINGLRITVESFASKQAQIRASAQLAMNAPDPLEVSATHQNLRALSAADADAAIESLSFWKARPALVVGFVGALIALGVSFGLPVTPQQTGAIMAVVTVSLALLASMRGRRTTAALVRAGERRGALAGPDSFRPGPLNQKDPNG